MFKIQHYKTLSSSNTKARQLLKVNSVIVAETQTAAKGRFERKWKAGKGGLWFSLTIKEKKPLNSKFLTFIAAIAMQKAIKKVTGIITNIKWPNDLLLNKKKVCGIVTEALWGKENYFIIGIGLNVSNRLPKNLKSFATKLETERGKQKKGEKQIDKDKILKAFLVAFEHYQKLYHKKRYKIILQEWKKASDNIGRKVKIKMLDKKIIKGTIKDIDKEGNLILKTNKNKRIKIIEGDLFL